jgi:predicted  nucleic acid-binding Zn-ribbon protein
MFGGGMYKIIAIVLAVMAAVGYFKYTQDKMAELNQQIATKEFALQTANATIQKQQEDLKLQQEVLQKTSKDFEEARAAVGELEDKFRKDGRDLDAFATAKPTEVQTRANAATKKVFRCIEQQVNKGKQDEGC